MPPRNQKFSASELIVDRLACWRGYQHLFTNMHFSLKSCEILALNGRNGIGKSSLLALLAGLLKSYSGIITYDNRPVSRQDVLWLGVILPFYPAVSLYDNLSLWAVLNNNDTATNVNNVLEIWQLHNHRNLAFNQLSRGQQQRAHLCYLTFNHCPIWLLDEPLTGLDQQGIKIFHNIVAAHLDNRGMIIMAPNIAGWDTKILDMAQFT